MTVDHFLDKNMKRVTCQTSSIKYQKLIKNFHALLTFNALHMHEIFILFDGNTIFNTKINI